MSEGRRTAKKTLRTLKNGTKIKEKNHQSENFKKLCITGQNERYYIRPQLILTYGS